VLGVVACRKLLLPPMLGYLAVGVLIGPNTLALAQNSEGVRHLGEFGVVFLMFVIGLEFNLPKLRWMRRHVFGLGLLQVALAVVPLLVLIPALGSSPDKLFMALALAGLKATLLVFLLLTGGQRVMRWWLTIVARRKSEELFVLNLLLVTLALAWLTELAGLSL